MHARLDRGAVRLLTRTGLDWTHKYPAVGKAVSTLGARQAYLDGELCGVFPDGITSFSMIQAASDAGNAAELVYFIFDPSASRRRRRERPAADQASWTDDNLLRQVVYEGLREDKPAAEVRRPVPHPKPAAATGPAVT
jgi:ATP-dependent DNA ligase